MSGWGGNGDLFSLGELGQLRLGALATPLLTPSRLGGEGTEALSHPASPAPGLGGGEFGGTFASSAPGLWKVEARP